MEPEELKKLVKNNDNTSRRILFEAYYKKTYAVAYNILRSHENAEDITQDAFIKAFQNIHQLQDGAKFGAWLAVIASNLARNYLKRDKKIYYTDEEVVVEDGSAVNSTEESALRNLEVDRVRKAIRDLPSEYYQVIVLQYYYELKVEEIADMLKLRTGTVKSRLHRARNRLVKDLELKDEPVCLKSKRADKGGEQE